MLKTNLLKCAERCKNRPSDPDTILPFGRSDHLNLHTARGECGNFLTHPVSDPGKHG
ncbi:hypothetical protein Hanom_Chr06g00577741 [Helianthus anomalus]